MCAQIIFPEDHVLWHPLLRLNRCYVVTNLSVSVLFRGKPREQSVWVAKTHELMCTQVAELSLAATLRTYATFAHKSTRAAEPLARASKRARVISVSSSGDSNSLPQLCTQSPEPRPPHVFVYATITAYLRNAVYELDHRFRLYLSHCPHSGRGLRVGAVLRLHHLHEVRLQGAVVGYACCTRSSIEAVRFSPLDDTPFVPACSPYKLLCQRVPLAQYVALLRAVDALMVKFALSRKQLLENTVCILFQVQIIVFAHSCLFISRRHKEVF